MDHRLVGAGITKFFAGESLDGFGIAAQGVELGLQIFGGLPLFVQFRIEDVNAPAHLLIFFDERQIGHADEQQGGNGQEGDDRLRKPAPDAKIYFHLPSLTPRGAEAKADFIVTRRKIDNFFHLNDKGVLLNF